MQFCCCSVSKLCPTLCNPMDCSMPSFPVAYHLLECAQVHVHRICGAIEPSHPVTVFSFCLQSSPTSGSFPINQLFASGAQNIGAAASASVLPKSIQGLFKTDWFHLLAVQGLSAVFSSTTVRKRWFFGALPSLLSSSHIHTWLLQRP